ncbi:hypothetical protein GCM10009665_42930 [Kitasatospora nipponensis]|uniref:Carrier domain-containing protein n=1 Tax=Kitasatospora nipponensis TaxID=258049 RepID=A0ABP4H2C9_9ACTN
MTTTPTDPTTTAGDPTAPSTAPSPALSPCELPLSVGQEAMWISWQVDPEQWTHIIPAPFQVTGTLDPARLRQAVAALGEAYPQLRARVVRVAGEHRLSWQDAPAIPVTEHTVTGDPTPAIRRVWQRPFDLRNGPLARIDLFHGDERTVLLLTIHHLVFDGASVLVLLDGLRRAYAGQPLSVPEHRAPLIAFARRSRELTDTPAGDALRAHWRAALGSDVPDFDLPASLDDPGFAVLSTAVPAELVPRLRARAEELGTSYFTVLFAAYFALLRRFTGRDELLVSIPYHGRAGEQLQELVGYFVNVLPIRHRLEGTTGFAELVQRLRGEVRAALTHGDLPLPAILREVGLTGWDAHARTHQSVFQYWHAGLRADVDVQRLRLQLQLQLQADDADDDSCLLSLLDIESSADYGLAVMVREDSGGTHVLWKNPSGSVGPTLLAALSTGYTELLTAIARDPRQSLAELTDPLVVPTPRDRPAPPAGDTPAPATAPATTGPTPDTTSGPAPTSLPATLALWEEVLGIDDIDPDDSFFELGGHSLLASSLVLAVSDYFGVEISVRALFETPRLAEFAAHIDAQLAAEGAPVG